MKDLERQFHKDMLNIYEVAKMEIGYKASRFLQIVCEKGGYIAAKQLILTHGGTSGFEILWENKRLDLSVEALVLNDKYIKLFTEMERLTCRERLLNYGYVITK